MWLRKPVMMLYRSAVNLTRRRDCFLRSGSETMQAQVFLGIMKWKNAQLLGRNICAE